MVKEVAPLAIPFRLPESYRMVLERPPCNEEQIPIRRLNASAELDANKTRRSCNQWAGFAHGHLKIRFLAWNDIQNCRLKDHSDIFAANF